MIIIIDGYNLLKILYGPEVSQTERSQFIAFLGQYRKKQEHDIMIVFDAGPCLRPTSNKQSGITVVYSGTYMSADQYIIEYVQKSKQQGRVLVTADRDLIRQVAVHEVHAVDPYTFYHRIHKRVGQIEHEKNTKNSKQNVIKYQDAFRTSSPQEDELMYEAAAALSDLYKDEEDSPQAQRSKKNKLSKKNKVLVSIKNKI